MRRFPPDPTARGTRGEGALLLSDGGSGLLAQIRWFNRLRFAAVVAMLLAGVAAGALGWIRDVLPLFWIAGLTTLVNLGYVAWARRLERARGLGAAAGGIATRTADSSSSPIATSMRRHVDLQIGVDLAILTVLLHFSGGVSNPLLLVFLFHTFIAAFLLSVRAAMVVAIVSMLLATGLAVVEVSGILPHRPIAVGIFDVERASSLALASWISTLGLVLALSIYFVSTIVEQLYKRDRALVGLSRQLALSEKLASIGTLAAGVSHEINNPVGVIRTRADVLRYRIADGDPPEVLLAEVDTIEKHTKRIAAITDGLLTFSRETPFQLRPTAVNDLVEEGVDLVRVPYQAAELGLDLRLDPAQPVVAGSHNHLLQVLINMLLNAKDASGRGTRVELSTACSADEVRIRIDDQGEGIPEASLDKIFDPFFTTKEVDRGTGLGLTLSHGIVERHGGRIEVRSRAGVGSTFTIVLPRIASPTARSRDAL